MKIAILGGGSWGTALAVHLARREHSINIWEFFEKQAEEMQTKRKCILLPEVKLPKNIFISSQMQEVLSESELVLVAVPSDKVEMTMKSASKFMSKQPVIICSKGFSKDLKLLNEVVEDLVKGKVYCLYGPTHAEEVCKEMFSGIVLAGGSGKEELKEEINSENFKVDLSKDIVGVQVSAALKNIFAIFIGVLDGIKAGDNAKAFVMTKGLEEIKQIGLEWGAKEDTFSGLAGMGDLIVTCTSEHSRNHYVGEQIGKGRKLEEITTKMDMVAEGITTLKLAINLKKKFDLELPLISGLYDIIFKGKSPDIVLRSL